MLKDCIDFLKIAPSFIRYLAPGSEEMILCAAIITMAHNLGLQVVAEGVETAAQAALLQELGCDAGQGLYQYRYSKAVPSGYDGTWEVASVGGRSCLRPTESAYYLYCVLPERSVTVVSRPTL